MNSLNKLGLSLQLNFSFVWILPNVAKKFGCFQSKFTNKNCFHRRIDFKFYFQNLRSSELELFYWTVNLLHLGARSCNAVKF